MGEKLDEAKLPCREKFYDDSNDIEISDQEYASAQKVWKSFDIKTMRDYTNLYLKTDVLLLEDIFENFRNICIEIYSLDPAHYYTLPEYSWDCMLKYTQVEIELFTDIDMLMFVECGLRGGISQCSNRYCETNNKYMNADYDPSKPSNYLIYFDVNNLYGWAMTQSLPISNYSWYYDEDLSNVQNIQRIILNTPNDADYGFLLEVDLEYPKELHDLHNDYPFCCEHLATGESKDEELVLTLYEEYHYVIHYRMLKLALQHGLKLKKVHKIRNGSKWINEYIMLNTHKRSQCVSTFEKNMF